VRKKPIVGENVRPMRAFCPNMVVLKHSMAARISVLFMGVLMYLVFTLGRQDGMSKLNSNSSRLLALMAVACACSCNSGEDLPDVTDIAVNVQLSRFDNDLFALDTASIDAGLNALGQRYPDFLRCFSENMIVPPTPVDSTARLRKVFTKLLTYRGLRAAYDSTQLRYANLDELRDELTLAFKYYAYYYPDSTPPRIVTFVSEYQYGVVTCSDSTLGIGLDFFLGKDFSFYSTFEIGIPAYRTLKMEREYIVPAVFRMLAYNMYGRFASTNTLLAQMIHNGKVAAFIDAMMPRAPDHLKIEYTQPQFQWCEDNEGEVWAYMKGEDLLFKTSKLEYQKYINDAPNTPGMPPEAPGNIGSWVGWRIVQAYMEETGASIVEVMNEPDYQRIFEQSRYKPK
jgi:hypothetical protein